MFVVERFSGNYVLAEQMGTGEIHWFEKEIFSENVYEGMSFEVIDGKAKIFTNKELEERIANKMKKLWI